MAYTVTFENGTTVKFEAEPTAADIEEVAQHLNLQPKQSAQPPQQPQPVQQRGSTILEDIKSGFMGAANNAATGVEMALAGAAGLVGAKDTQEKLFDTIKQQEDYWRLPEGVKQNEVGKIVSALAGVPQFLNPITTTLQLAGSGSQRARNYIEAGGGVGGALASQAIDTVLGVGGVAVPAQLVTGRLKNALATAVTNTAQEKISHEAQQAIRSANNVTKLPDMDVGDYMAAAIPGFAMGAMLGKPSAKTTGKDEGPVRTEGDRLLPEQQEEAHNKIMVEASKRIEIINKIREDHIKELKLLDDVASFRGLTEKQLKKYEFHKNKLEELTKELDEPQKVIDTITNIRNIDKAKAQTAEDNARGPVREASPEEAPPIGMTPDEFQALQRTQKATEVSEPQLPPTNAMEVPLKPNEGPLETPVRDTTGKTPEQIFKETLDSIDLNLDTPPQVRQARDIAAKALDDSPLRRTDQALVDAIAKNGTEGGLDHIIQSNPKAPESVIAQALKNNPKLRPVVDFLTGAYGGSGVKGDIDAGTMRMRLWDTGKNAGTFIHEMLHAATMKALHYYKNGMGSALSLEQRVAVSQLTKLYDKVAPKLPAVYAEAKKSVDEFISHGMTDPVLRDMLAKIPYDGGNAATSFVNKIANLLGFKGLQRTALGEMMLHTETLIKKADGMPFGSKMNLRTAKDDVRATLPYKDTDKSIPVEDLIKGAQQGIYKDMSGSWLSRNLAKLTQQMFGDQQWIEMIKRDAPLVYAVWKETELLSREAIKQKHTWLEGAAFIPQGKAFWNRLSHYDNPTSVKSLLTKADVADVIAVQDLFKKGYDEGLSYSKAFEDDPNAITNLEKNGQHLTDAQKTLYNSLADMYTRMAADTRIKHPRKGWYPAVRKGDHIVTVRTELGIVSRVESFRTKAEADIFRDRVAQTSKFSTDYMDKSVETDTTIKDSFNIIRDMFEGNLSGKYGPEAANEAKSILDVLADKQSIMAMKAGLGKHDVHRTGIEGYAGNQWFKTREQNANAFREAMFDAASEYASLYRNRGLSQTAEKYLMSPELQQAFPNQIELAQRLLDNAMNRNEPLLKKGTKQSMKEQFDDWVVKNIDSINRNNTWLKSRGYEIPFPRVSLLDRVNGIGAQLFYISALTTRPAFWAAQLLSSPFSARQMFKEGTLGETVMAQMRGMGNVLTGGSPEFRRIVMRLANESDSLVPQFTNDINSIGQRFLSDGKHATIKTIFEWSTGQYPASMADAISRYITASTAYEFYKPRFKNDENGLLRAVETYTDRTMVMYSREHTSPILQRMGLVGQAVAPLQKYAIAQLGNLMADFKHIKDNEYSVRSTVPLLNTFMTSMLMGGTMGVVLGAEYELLRKLFEWLTEDFEDLKPLVPPPFDQAVMNNSNLLNRAMASMYSATGISEEKSIEMAQLGIPSAVAGMDIGSGLRFQAFTPTKILEGLAGGKDVSWLDAVPIVNFAVTFAQGLGTSVRASLGGNVTEAEERKAYMKFQPVVGSKAVIDRYKFDADTRPMVPEGARGFGGVPQTGEEELATLLGTRTTHSFKERTKLFVEKREEKKIVDRVNKQIDLFLDGRGGDSVNVGAIMRTGMKNGMNPESILNKIANTVLNRNMDARTRFVLGPDMNMSLQEMLRYAKLEEQPLD